MSGKKLLIVMGLVAVVCFGAAFVLTMLAGSSGEVAPPTAETAVALDASAGAALAQIETLNPREQQLDELIREVRQRIEAVRRRSREQDEREKRLEMLQEQLQKDAKELETLRVQLAAPLIRLREIRDELAKTRVQIAREEQTNLMRTAKIYEKMPGEQGGRLLQGMCENEQIEDAVKILFYMSEKGVARLMAEFPDESLAAELFTRLKTVREES
jgi:septal ring factor EnvC (AmiA/AmiB activator)